jgi:NAD(P)-dependent dehydrogenase (short-subunit alcohol dehydrogenase family)
MSNGEVHGRVVTVTGASGGVGRAVVREFAKRGDSIALLFRGEVGLAAIGSEVTVAGATPMVAADGRVGHDFGAHGAFDQKAKPRSAQCISAPQGPLGAAEAAGAGLTAAVGGKARRS